jgi:hypothetical protein
MPLLEDDDEFDLDAVVDAEGLAEDADEDERVATRAAVDGVVGDAAAGAARQIRSLSAR